MVTQEASRSPEKENAMGESELTDVWLSIRFFLLIAAGISALGIVFFAVA
jgi:hypothetical protein